MARSCVALTMTTLLAMRVPIETRAPDTNPVPDTVIVVPPVLGPLAGDTAVTVGRVPGVLVP